MNKLDVLASKMQAIMSEADNKKPKPYDTSATVMRVDGNTVWVHIPGGIDETPVQRTINALPGDKVQVRVSGGNAWIMGNATAPPTDDRVANRATIIAKDASTTAQNALQNADIAQQAAESAIYSAGVAHQAATSAQASAEEAYSSATQANTAANGALSQLGVVEDVVGTLNWISQHGRYTLTADTTVVPGKYYFSRSGDIYTVVINPTGNPSAQGYYELDSIDEAVSNYVASHLALTNAGLWVVNDNNSYKILLASDGMKVYDSQGNLVSTFGESISFSSSRAQYIGNDQAYILFNPVNNTINIGGTGIQMSGRPLSELLSDISEATSAVDDMQERMDSGEFEGASAVTLRIDSSRGTVFKNSEVNTVLSVVIYYKEYRIEGLSSLHSNYNSTAYLQWYWQGFDESTWHTLAASDSRLSNDGFTLTLSPQDVDQKIVFQCNLITS